MHPLKRAILKTLAYSDIFDFPLTKEEIWQYLISDNFKYPISNIQFQSNLEDLKKYISFQNGYFCFKGREAIIDKRKKRKHFSENKLILANKIAKKLSIIPTINLIAISGSLAIKNADVEDDIDFFIISEKGTIWITRLLVTLYLEVLGIRRRKKETLASNKICLNMFMDKRDLALSKKRQTNYSAHEIVQMKVILDRNNTHRQFMYANNWIKFFLPNSKYESSSLTISKNNWIGFYLPFEKVCKILQLWYSSKNKRHEEITNTLLAFHPINREEIIEKMLQERIKKYGI